MEFINVGEKKINIKLLNENIKEYCILVYGGEKGNLHPNTLESRKSEVKIARELQKYIYMLTDISIPIVYDHYNTVFNREIRIGNTKRTITQSDDLGDDGYRIKTVGKHLEIVGGIRGVLYGVYSFIEKYFGIRYFTAVVEKMIDNRDLDIGEIDEKFIPQLEYRDIMFCETWDKRFSVKQKINGLFSRPLGEEEGYGVGYAGGFDGLCHTFWPLVPKAEYFEEHPEYYALIDGKRNPDGLCLTNQGTFDVFLKNLKNWLYAEKEPRLVSVSVNDNNCYCRCPKCSAIDEREESHSGQVLQFVNRIADAIKDEFPKVRVDTLSYSFARRVPKYIKPRENVAIRTCVNISCSNHGIKECTEPTPSWNSIKGFYTPKFVEDIEGWSKVCDKIYVWDYVINYYHINAIYPTFHTFLPRMKFYMENNVKGIYYEGSSDSGEFYELRSYLLAKLSWNPAMDENEFNTHMNEFIYGYYGKGGKYIKEFIDYSANYMKDMHFGIMSPLRFMFPSEEKNGRTVYSLEFFKKSRELFEKAKTESNSIGDRERIDKASIQVDYCDLFLNMDYYMSIANDEEKKQIIEKNKALYNKMIKFNALRLIENEEILKIKDFSRPPYTWTCGHEEQLQEHGLLFF